MRARKRGYMVQGALYSANVPQGRELRASEGSALWGFMVQSALYSANVPQGRALRVS